MGMVGGGGQQKESGAQVLDIPTLHGCVVTGRQSKVGKRGNAVGLRDTNTGGREVEETGREGR